MKEFEMKSSERIERYKNRVLNEFKRKKNERNQNVMKKMSMEGC